MVMLLWLLMRDIIITENRRGGNMILGIDKTIEDLKGWSKLEYLWMFVAVGTILGLSVYWGDTPLGMVSAVTNIMCVLLVAKGKISNYWYGLIGVVTYAYISYTSGLYGDTMLNSLYYLPMQFIGYYMWSKNMGDKEIIIKKLSLRKRIVGFILSIIVIALYGTFLHSLGGNVPYVDATSTVLSIIAMVLLSFGYAEQWALWIVVNIVSISMWVSVAMIGQGSVSMLIMWIIFLLNSCFGYYKWNKKE